jgi:hypothetical protein
LAVALSIPQRKHKASNFKKRRNQTRVCNIPKTKATV